MDKMVLVPLTQESQGKTQSSGRDQTLFDTKDREPQEETTTAREVLVLDEDEAVQEAAVVAAEEQGLVVCSEDNAVSMRMTRMRGPMTGKNTLACTSF